MRGARPIGLLLLVLCGGCLEQPATSPTSDPPADKPGGAPGWVPALTPQQTALVAPVERAIKSPASRVFPDLGRFGYSNNRPLADLDHALKFTRMVTQVLNDSPRFYSLEELPPGAENVIAQYGPAPDEPDGFKIVKRGEDGEGQLVPSPDAEEARAAISQADEARKAGDQERAVTILRASATRAPAVPAIRMALGDALVSAGRTPEAVTAYRELLAADPTFAPAHLALAEIDLKRGDRAAARRSLVEALAYHPASTRGLEILRKLASGGGAAADGGWYDPPPAAGTPADGRIAPFSLFLDVDSAGAVHVATPKGDAAQIYGGCRAVMRYEPTVRAQIFKVPQETPYYLSVAEEVVCLEAALGAYLAAKGERSDAGLEQLLRIDREDGLSGYVMFEILGQHRPERARTAPPDVHRETAAYLTRWVLARHEPIPEGIYTAKR
jgi:tetratricopeptide (TPR) repeat protein